MNKTVIYLPFFIFLMVISVGAHAMQIITGNLDSLERPSASKVIIRDLTYVNPADKDTKDLLWIKIQRSCSLTGITPDNRSLVAAWNSKYKWNKRFGQYKPNPAVIGKVRSLREQAALVLVEHHSVLWAQAIQENTITYQEVLQKFGGFPDNVKCLIVASIEKHLNLFKGY